MKRVKDYIDRLYKMKNILNSNQGIKFNCFNQSPKNEKSGGIIVKQARAIPCIGEIGLKQIGININEKANVLNYSNLKNNIGLIAHELSHLYCTKDIAWFMDEDKIATDISGTSYNPSEISEWNVSAEHYAYYSYYKFHLHNLFCTDEEIQMLKLNH